MSKFFRALRHIETRASAFEKRFEELDVGVRLATATLKNRQVLLELV